MAQGILSGKYNDGVAPEESRFAEGGSGAASTWARWFSTEKHPKTVAMLHALAAAAKKLGCT